MKNVSKKRQIIIALLILTVIASVFPLTTFAQNDDIDAKVAEMEGKIGKVEGKDKRFVPSRNLLEYAKQKIDVDNPTEILDYSSKTQNHLPSDTEAKEYFIKAVSESQAGVVLYGDKDFAKKTIEGIIYSASYGIYLKHLKNWKIESELVDQTNDIYRHLVSFQYQVPKSHTREMEDRIDTISKWISDEVKNVKISDELIKKNSLDDKAVEDLKKAMLIHDYVIKNVRPYYGNSSFIGTYNAERHSMNSAMFEGETVCQGYAMLFSRIADRVGLETRMVRAYKGFVNVYDNENSKQNYINQMRIAIDFAKKGGRWGMDTNEYGANHGWNQVKIGNKWYHADMSGDSAYTHPKFGESWPAPTNYIYKYFLRTDKELKKPVEVQFVDDHEKYGTQKQFLVWQENENYDTPEEPFVWTYDTMYDFALNQGINSKPYLNREFENTYPMGRVYDGDKGKFTFDKKDLKHTVETRYEITVPGYKDGGEAIKIKSGLKTPEEALKFAGVSGIMFKDGNRNAAGYVDYSIVKAIDVKHKDQKEVSEFDKVKNKVGEKISLTAYFEADSKVYSKKILLKIAADSEFKSNADLRLKADKDNVITLPQHVFIKNNKLENQRLRDEKIKEIDKEILSRVEVVLNEKSQDVSEYKGEHKIIWKNTKYNDENVPIDSPTKDKNFLVRTILVRGEDGKWTSLDFNINLTEVEKTTTTKIECDTYYLEKDVDDKVGLYAIKRGKQTDEEIADGGDFEKFFRYRKHPITMVYISSSGFESQRLTKNVYLLDDKGNYKYRTKKSYNGILLEKDSKGEWKSEVGKTLNQLFTTPGTYKFRIEANNDEDGIIVKRDFTVRILSKEESEKKKAEFSEAKEKLIKLIEEDTIISKEKKDEFIGKIGNISELDEVKNLSDEYKKYADEEALKVLREETLLSVENDEILAIEKKSELMEQIKLSTNLEELNSLILVYNEAVKAELLKKELADGIIKASEEIQKLKNLSTEERKKYIEIIGQANSLETVGEVLEEAKKFDLEKDRATNSNNLTKPFASDNNINNNSNIVTEPRIIKVDNKTDNSVISNDISSKTEGKAEKIKREYDKEKSEKPKASKSIKSATETKTSLTSNNDGRNNYRLAFFLTSAAIIALLGLAFKKKILK